MNEHPTITSTAPSLAEQKRSQHLPDQRPSGWGLSILLGLGAAGKAVYGGTVPPETVSKRRAANRAARKSRRTNRGNR